MKKTISDWVKHDVWPELRAVLAVACSVTTALYIKRVVEKLVTRKVISKEVFEHGLKRPAQSATSLSVPTNGNGTPFGHYRPGATSRGSGVTYVESRRYGRLLVHYRRTVEDKDTVLYEHDEKLNPYHQWPCPLLRIDTACDDCPYFINQGRYRSQPICAAQYKLENCPDEYFHSVDDIRNELENS